MCYLDCHCSLSTRKSRSHSGCRTSIFVNSHLLVVKHGQQPCSRRCRHPLALSGARGRRGLVPGHPSPPNTPETMVDIGDPHIKPWNGGVLDGTRVQVTYGYLHPNTKQMPLNLQATCSSWTRTSRASAPSCRRPPRRRRSLWPAWLPPKQHSLASAASLRRAVGIREAGTKLLGKTWWANFVWHVVLNVGYVGLLKFQLARRLISSWEVWYAELAECEHVWRPHFVYGLEEAAAQWRALPRHEQSEYTTRAAALRESRCGDVGRVS